MPTLPPQIVNVDDIVISHLTAGHYTLVPQSVNYQEPHRCLVVLMEKGELLLDGDHTDPLVMHNENGIVIFPWQRCNLTISNTVLSIEIPSYRLKTCSLSPLFTHRLSYEQTYLLSAQVKELLDNSTLLKAVEQRFIANALSTIIQLPEPNERLLEEVENEDRETSLREHVARTMCARMHEESLRVDDITSSLGISRAQLYRTISSYGGFKSCLHAQRLDWVARYLKRPTNDSLAIKSILFKCGFSTTEQFQRLFQKRFLISARDFRSGKPTKKDTFKGFQIERSSLTIQ